MTESPHRTAPKMTAQSEEDSQFEDLPDEDIYMSNVKALRSAAEPVYASKAYLRVAANAGYSQVRELKWYRWLLTFISVIIFLLVINAV